jgi:hypothetical protein
MTSSRLTALYFIKYDSHEGFWSLLRSGWQSRRCVLQESFMFHSVS